MAKNAYEQSIAPYLDKIAAWARKGATSREICKKLGVSYSTFRKYCAAGEKGDPRYRELAETFARAREEPDDNVEAALYKRACGFEYVEEKTEQKLARDGSVVVLKTTTNKVIPPDPTSAMFWLANRRPDRWKYKPEPAGDDEDEGSGVVMLAPVMDNPGPPDMGPTEQPSGAGAPGKGAAAE